MKKFLSRFLFSSILLLGVQGNRQVIAQSEEGNATVETIIDNTDNWVGKTVTITGKIDERKDDSSFTVEGDNYFDSDRVLIINESGEFLPELPEENINLRITGRVDLVGGEEYFEGTAEAVAENIAGEFETKPAIYADSIILAPAPDEVVETPSDFYGRSVAVSGIVADVLDDNAFTLKEFSLNSDRNLLVLNMTGEPLPETGAEVLIEGEIQAYDRDRLEQEYGYDEDLSVSVVDRSEDPLAKTAVLVVEKISPTDVNPSRVDVDVVP